MTQLGKYEILDEIGRGGFGVVYRALDTWLQIERALKVLHPALIIDPQVVERFKREAQVAAGLDHPVIVPVYDIGEAEGRVYLAMRFMAGGSLKDRLAARGKLPYQEALDILHQVAEGVDYAHQHGIVHRDLKPGNILFNEDGKVCISDFGFAKILSETGSDSLSRSGGLIGTPAYMAPELWNGHPPPSPATDVYALACIFYEMVTGQVLFNGNTPMAVMTKHAQGPSLEDVDWPAEAPEEIKQVIASALAKDPTDRIESAISLFHALIAVRIDTRQEESETIPRQDDQAEHHPPPPVVDVIAGADAEEEAIPAQTPLGDATSDTSLQEQPRVVDKPKRSLTEEKRKLAQGIKGKLALISKSHLFSLLKPKYLFYPVLIIISIFGISFTARQIRKYQNNQNLLTGTKTAAFIHLSTEQAESQSLTLTIENVSLSATALWDQRDRAATSDSASQARQGTLTQTPTASPTLTRTATRTRTATLTRTATSTRIPPIATNPPPQPTDPPLQPTDPPPQPTSPPPPPTITQSPPPINTQAPTPTSTQPALQPTRNHTPTTP